ncbi:MAG: S4 domain-containing protein, partial [Mycoplasmatales bacterium]
SIEDINGLEQECVNAPHLRSAQKALAYEITKFVHGKNSVDQVIKITKCLFTGDISNLTIEEIENNFTDIKQYQLDDNLNILDALIMVQLASSKREAREFVSAGSITIASEKITDLDYIVSSEVAIGGKYLMIKRGKKKIHFVKVV